MFVNVIQLGYNVLNRKPCLLTESRISASATGIRGLITHLKGTGYLLSQVISGVYYFHILLNIFTSKIRWWTQVWAWGHFPRRQLEVWCHIPREDRMQSSITSCRLRVFQDILEKNKCRWACMLENMLCLLTDVQTQTPHSLDPSHRDWVFHPLDIVQAGILGGCWKL